MKDDSYFLLFFFHFIPINNVKSQKKEKERSQHDEKPEHHDKASPHPPTATTKESFQVSMKTYCCQK